ncbi:MAG: sodium:proline symporter [Sulfuricella sp.]|nr:sodium:proline symporter [Sulfuricella sp.]
MVAGIVAGFLATVFQVACWWGFTDALPGIFFRDTRLTAAIVMGRAVLPPPAGFDAGITVVATLVHLILSALYGLILATLLARLDSRQWLGAGALFGVLLYVINLYGFTIFFPWFSAARDPITAATHAVFGITAAATYQVLARRSAAS